METFLKYFLVVYYILFFASALILPTYRVWKTTGINPYKLGNTDSAHDYVGKIFRLTLIACILVVLVFVFSASAYQQLIPIPYLSHPIFSWIGIAILLFALVWVLTAQSQMQKSWRIGIDEDVKTDLVERGLFKISRNPIFLGMRAMLIGFFLVLPNAATLAILLLGEVLIQIQVRLEEAHLRQIHGDFYDVYMRRVRRWL